MFLKISKIHNFLDELFIQIYSRILVSRITMEERQKDIILKIENLKKQN